MTDESRPLAAPKHRRWLSWIGVVLLVWLFWHLGPHEILSAISRTDMRLFALAALLYIPTLVLRVWRWQWLLRCIGVRYQFVPACQGYLIGILIGLATPGRVGEFSRAIFLRQDRAVPLARGLPMVLADRLFDFLVVLPLGILALVSFGPVAADSVWIAVAVLVVMMLGGLGIILRASAVDRVRRFVGMVASGTRYGSKVSELLLEMHQGFRQIRLGVFALALLATAAAYLIFFLECYLIAKSLGIEVTPLTTTYAISVGTLVAMIPVSISGVGTRDAAIVAFLALHSVPSASAIGFSLLWFVAFYGLSGVLGAAAWGMKNFISRRP